MRLRIMLCSKVFLYQVEKFLQNMSFEGYNPWGFCSSHPALKAPVSLSMFFWGGWGLVGRFVFVFGFFGSFSRQGFCI